MARRPEKHLWDASAAAERIARFTSGKSLQDYLCDEMLRSAVERQFEIVGEALSQFRRAAPEREAEIPELARIVGFRNLLAHDYDDVKDEIVWGLVQGKLAELRATLAKLLAEQGKP